MKAPLFCTKVPGLTPIDAREASAEVDHCWQLGNAPFLGIPRIGHLNKCNIQIICLAVNVFEFLQSCSTVWLIVFI